MRKGNITLKFIISIIISIFFLTGCISQPENSTITLDQESNEANNSEQNIKEGYYKVELDKSIGGSFTVVPAIPEDGLVKAGTEFILTAVPDEGYILDSLYKMIWIMEEYNYGYYFESMETPYKAVIDPNDARFQTAGPSNVYRLGASFIKESEVSEIVVTQNVEYAKISDNSLVYDVFAPKNAKDLPGVVVIHGGGWTTNSEDIMRGMGREISNTGKYVVFNIDYRLLSDLNNDSTSAGNSLIDIIEDVFGAVAHIQANSSTYGINPEILAVTGDSAGGYLAAVVANMSNMIGTSGFDGTNFEFWPTGVEKDDVAIVRTNIINAVKVAAPSYGVFAMTPARSIGRAGMLPLEADDSWYDILSPQSHIPNVSDRTLPPQQCQTGTEDFIVTPASVAAYTEALQNAGQIVELVEVPGAMHAYFDWKPSDNTKATFNSTGKEYIAKMIQFFENNL